VPTPKLLTGAESGLFAGSSSSGDESGNRQPQCNLRESRTAASSHVGSKTTLRNEREHNPTPPQLWECTPDAIPGPEKPEQFGDYEHIAVAIICTFVRTYLFWISSPRGHGDTEDGTIKTGR